MPEQLQQRAHGDLPHGAQRVCLVLWHDGTVIPVAYKTIVIREDRASLFRVVPRGDFALQTGELEQALPQRTNGFGTHRRQFVDGFKSGLLVGTVERTHPYVHFV